MSYVVVPLVVGEAHKEHIAAQVIEPVLAQLEAGGGDRPASAIVVLVEAARVAASAEIRSRVNRLTDRAHGVRVLLWPAVSRLGLRLNARLLAARLRTLAGDSAVVFHCRGEDAVEWATALRQHFTHAGVVADIRGAGAEEVLHSHGYDGPHEADAPRRQAYHVHMSRLHAALANAGAVLSVSPGMIDWLRELGVSDDRLGYVPCAVPRLAYSDALRERTRREHSLTDKVVFEYLGVVASYQYIEDGVIPFFQATLEQHPRAHLLCITTHPVRMRSLLAEAGIPTTATTVMCVPQNEVAGVLAGADCGLLLKGPSRLNRVWQPIKLGEYLASGLPVVVSRGVGRVDALIAESGAGVVVGVPDPARGVVEVEADRTYRTLSEHGPALRAAALALCARHFLWAGHVSTMRQAYHRALESDGVRPAAVSFGP